MEDDINNEKKEVDLSGEWFSSFVQNNRIYNEEITIEQNKNRIDATIKLNFDGEIFQYKFNGVMNKNVINGIYEYVEDSDIESGVMSLKIINNNFLFGVETHFSIDTHSDDIIQSPYALFRKTDNDLGTFDLCSECVGKENNCCCSSHVDMPVLLPSEAENISSLLKLKKEDFLDEINLSEAYEDNSLKKLYQMKRNKEINGCCFYKNNQCSIYDNRPIDCKMYPYDIKLEEDGNYYLVYYTSKGCKMEDINLNNIKMVSYNTRLFLRLILPYIREWTRDCFVSKLTDGRGYNKICKIEDLF